MVALGLEVYFRSLAALLHAAVQRCRWQRVCWLLHLASEVALLELVTVSWEGERA